MCLGPLQCVYRIKLMKAMRFEEHMGYYTHKQHETNNSNEKEEEEEEAESLRKKLEIFLLGARRLCAFSKISISSHALI